jgi:calnexin
VFVTVLFKILFGGKKPVVSYSQPMFYCCHGSELEENACSTHYICLFQAPVKPAAEAKKPKATVTDGAGSSGDKDEKEDEKEETAGPRRRTRRET